MTEQEHYAKQSCWRCRRCGSRTPLEKSVCSNPACRAELSIFGEVCTPASDPAEPDVGHPGIDAGLAASIFHTRQVDIRDLKRFLRTQGVEVRV